METGIEPFIAGPTVCLVSDHTTIWHHTYYLNSIMV